MNQVIFSIVLLAILIQASITVGSNLSTVRKALNAKSTRFATNLNVSNTLGVFEFCKIALGGQTVRVTDFASKQPIQVFMPNAAGARGERIAAQNMQVGPFVMGEVALQILRSTGSNHLARFTMQLQTSANIAMMKPLILNLVFQGTPDASGNVVIQSCRTDEQWTQIGSMRTCPSDQIVAGFNPDGSLVCQTGPPGPAGPAGAPGAMNCPEPAPTGVVSLCVPSSSGGTTWAPL